MRELDKKEKYDLRDLDILKLEELNITLHKDEEAGWLLMDINTLVDMSKTHNLVFYDDVKWGLSRYLDRDKATKNALTLFEPQLKIGDTFEYNRFLCRVESKIIKWYVVGRGLDAYYTTLTEEAVLWLRAEDVRVEEITNKEFIKQLEENAL